MIKNPNEYVQVNSPIYLQKEIGFGCRGVAQELTFQNTFSPRQQIVWKAKSPQLGDIL